MTGDGSKTTAWGDGEHKFRLGIGELRELQDKCGAGPFVVLRRLSDGSWLVDDVTQPLRLGLIGGGMDPTRALAKVAKFVVPTQFLFNVVTAREVLSAALFGDPEDIVGKEAGRSGGGQQTESNSRNSSAPPPPLGGQSTSLTAQASGNSQPPLMAGTDATVQRMNGPNR